MKKASKLLVGKKIDFSSFCKTDSLQNVNPIKTIMKIDIIKKNEEINLIFEAKSFLHNMIRIISGVLLEIGRSKIDIKDMENFLKSKKRCPCETLPAYGLYFTEIKY